MPRGREEEGSQAQVIAHASVLHEDDLCALKGEERRMWCQRSPQVGVGEECRHPPHRLYRSHERLWIQSQNKTGSP